MVGRRVLIGVLAVAVVLVGLATMAWSTAGEPVWWTRADITEHGTEIRVRYTGSECDQQRSVDVDESSAEVVLTVTTRALTSGCSDVGVARTAVARLEAPLGERALFDGTCLDGADRDFCRTKVTLTGAEGRAVRKPLHAPANYDPDTVGFVACAKTLVEGRVVRVVDGAPGRMLTTLHVDTWVRPASGPSTITVDTPDIAAEGAYDRWPAAMPIRLFVDVDPDALPSWHFEDPGWRAILDAAPKAEGSECFYGP
ncbi:hypothetical protein [Mumia sp. DW29H23]|uniref:hypothetical protein n=1 Tax=Mumia sp. DW29H23 TaxID=3421241 RepID=UPI003D6893B0